MVHLCELPFPYFSDTALQPLLFWTLLSALFFLPTRFPTSTNLPAFLFLVQLCELPFPYFSDSALQPLLFGTLLSACYGSDRNRDVVERELSADMLLGFLQTSAAELPDEVRGAAAASKEKGGERGGASGRALVTGESSVGSLAGDSQSGETSEVQATMQEVKNGAGELSESLANGPGLGTEGKMNFAAKPSSESGAAAEAGTADSEKAGTAGAEVTVEAQREGAETAPDDRKSVRNLQIAEVGRSDTGALKSAVKPSNDGTVKPDATSAADQRTDSVNSKGAAKTGTEPSKPGTDEKSAARLRDSKRESRSRPGSAGARGSKDRGENKLDNRIPSAGIAKRADPTGAKKAGQELAAPFRLQNRFPVSLWTAAEEYFAKPPGKH